ncbi:hypothetical protein P4278_30580 [Bacillus thuringiensis]|nr:hypothetical protein [Bacillus thuringiensis]MED2783956.1 hypothetical protein [Bacillus thuringiensis]
MTYVFFFVLVAIILYQGYMFRYIERLYREEKCKLIELWSLERKELYNRIQAPSFAEYKQGEVKMVKAQKEEKTIPTYHLE